MSRYKYSTKYLKNPKITKEDLPKLRKDLEEAIANAAEDEAEYSVYEREAQRLSKLIDFLELEHDLIIQMYSTGEAIINNKYIISLRNRRWRVKGFSEWYWHKQDIKDFTENVILKYKLKRKKEEQHGTK